MIQENISLKPYNTFGIEEKTNYFSQFTTVEELKEFILDAQFKSMPKLILGGGSNILLTKTFEGLVLQNKLNGITIEKEDDDFVWVKSMAGEDWHKLVLFAIENDFGGIENLSLIPGSVGAAPMQNIGAYGVEIKDVFHELEAMDIDTGHEVRFTKKRCRFGYRESVFKNVFKDKYIITSITLKLTKKPVLNTKYGAIQEELKNVKHPNIKHVSDAIIKIRQSKLPDPKEIGNSGSFFKNPVISIEKFEKLKANFPEVANYPINKKTIKIAAGWLIDQAGWKGKKIGNYGVHENQALVLVNYGGANGKDIYNLSEEIMLDIKKKFDIQLEREVNIF